MPILSIGETSTGAGDHCDGWSCERELQAHKDLLVRVQRAFPTTPAFASPNFACYDIPTELVPFLVDRCAGMWPPNVKGDNSLLDEQAYASMRAYHDTIATGVLLDPWNDLNDATPAERLSEV